MGALDGKRVLIVEDEALIAMTVEDMLASAGAVAIGPARNIDQGMKLAAREAIDIALLDVNLSGQQIDPVADVLDRRKIPYLLATGYSQVPDGLPRSTHIISKPYVEEVLVARLLLLLQSRGGSMTQTPPQSRQE